MIKTTRQQREALFRIFQREFPSWITPTTRKAGDPANGTIVKVPSIQYRRFLKKCQPEFCSHGAIMVPYAGMWIGVERDGYAHT